MIETTPVARNVRNDMNTLWKMGAEAAKQIKLRGFVGNNRESHYLDVDYQIEKWDVLRSNFEPALNRLVPHGFLVVSHSILEALEYMTLGVSEKTMDFLHTHTDVQFIRRQTGRISQEAEEIDIFFKYQALVAGFYYQLLAPLVSLEHTKPDSYFRGIWGHDNSLFISMCIQFAQEFWERGRSVSRTHVLYMLATMYGGWQEMYSKASSKTGLLGVLGSISVLSASLLRVTDVPEEIAKFAVVDIPIIDLMSETNGELYACKDTIMDFFVDWSEPADVVPMGPAGRWSVHAKMGVIVGSDAPGVSMAARCNGRLVGWFSPLAADIAFLNTTYVTKRGEDQETRTLKGHEVLEKHWLECRIHKPSITEAAPEGQLVIVHSRGCPALRYAAAGFYNEVHEELAIATDNIDIAFGRVDVQRPAVIII